MMSLSRSTFPKRLLGRRIFYFSLFLLGALGFSLLNRQQTKPLPQTETSRPPVQSVGLETTSEAPGPPTPSLPTETPPILEESPLPSSYDIAIPFAVQAPTANWDAFHEEACEEASALMVADYFNQRAERTAAQIEEGLNEIAVWERKNLGTDVSISAKDTVRILREHLKLDSELIEDPTAEQIKVQLSRNHPVIVPAHGRSLKNPYFTPPGPVYHMLVLRGYQEGKFITNDPGTKRGKGYRYPEDVLLSAIHDWNDGQVEEGAKVAIRVKGKLP